MRICRRNVLTAVCLTSLLLPCARGGEEPIHLLTVPWTDRAPMIDGQLAAGEWDRAAESTGWLALRTGQLSEKPSRLYLAFDDERLYIAIVTEYEGATLDAKVKQDDNIAVSGDDSIEIHLALAEDRYIQFIGNSLGARFDALVNGKQIDATFNADWTFANTTRYRDTVWQVGGIWTAELSVPFADLGEDTPTNGTTWRANFCRTWNKTEAAHEQRYSSVSPVEGGFRDPGNFTTLRFMRTGALVQVADLGQPVDGDVKIRGRVLGLAGAARTIEVTAEVVDEAGQRLTRVTDIAEVAADAAREVSLDGVISASDDLTATLSIVAREKVSGNVCYSSRIPFHVRPAFRIDVAPAFLQGYVELRYDLSRIAVADDRATLSVALRGEAEQEPLTSASIELAAGDARQGTVRVSLAYLGPGRYELHVDLKESGGNEAGVRTIDFVVPPKPSWAGNDLGREPKVPAPWTPIELEDRSVNCWGRSYRFRNSLFPEQITSRGEALLTAPIRLELRTADGEVDTTRGSMMLTRVDDATVKGTWSGGNGKLKLQGEVSIDFDGFAEFALTLVPEGEVSIERMAMHITMPAARALDTKGLIKPPPDGPHHVHASLYPGASGPFRYRDAWIYEPSGWVWTNSFVYYAWVGDNWRGLVYTTDSDENWHTDQYLAIDRDEQDARLTFSVIDRPTVFDQPVTYRFGFQATPVKPLPRDGRRWHVGFRGRPEQLDPHGADAELIEAVTSYGSTRWAGYPEPGGQAATRIAGFHERGVKMVPNYFNQVLAGETPEFQLFGREWEKIPGKNYKTKYHGTFRGVCPASNYSDFYVSGINKLQEFGFDGIYQDVSGIPLCENGLHGCGYTDAEGIRQRTYGVFRTRRMYKRQYTVIKNHDPDAVVFHHGIVPAPILAYVDACTEGESWLPIYRRGDRLSDMSLSHYRAQQMYQERYGIPVLFYAGTVSRGEHWDEIPNLLCLTLLHNQYPDVPSDLRAIDDLIATWKIMDRWIAAARWIPYWSADLPVRVPADQRIHASAWCERDDKKPGAMIVVSNLGTEPWEGAVILDAAALGLDATADWQALDPVTGQGYAVLGNALDLAIPARTPRYILLEPTPLK